MNKTLSFKADIKAQEEGVVEAIVSVFGNRDRGGDIVRPGAFAGSLAGGLPKVLWCHDPSKPIGKTLEARELEPGDERLPERLQELGGLYVKGALNLKTESGRDAYEHLKFGSIDEYSFGYRVIKDSWNQDTQTRELLELELFEWSPVVVGMNPATQTISVHGMSLDGLTLDEHSEAVLDAAKGLVGRVKALADMRGADGRRLGEKRLAQVAELRRLLDDLGAPEQDAAGGTDRFKELVESTLALRARALETIQ